MGRTSKRAVIALATLAAATALTTVPAPTGADPAPPTAGGAPALLQVDGPSATTSRTITSARSADVDTSLLTPGVERTVSIDVVDTDLVVELDPIASGAPGWAAWNGTIASAPDSSATIVRQGDDVAGIISTPDGSYRIRTTAPGQQVVQEIAPSFPESHADHLEPPASSDLGVGPDAASSAGDAAAEADVPTDPVIDVLVAYTPAALSRAGTLSAMNSEIALAISSTNTAYANSGVVGRVRLTGTTQLTANQPLTTASLNQVTAPDDGIQDQIHSVRNTTGADLVSVLTDASTTGCGLGWILSGVSSASAHSPFGFSLVEYSCAVDNYSFAHELGHNMGLDHDRYALAEAGKNPVLFPYSVGYVDVEHEFRTIMAYNDQCDDHDPAVYCTRLGRFSNPDQTYAGAPLGRPSAGSEPADGRKALNATQAFVASWRAKPAPFTSWTRFVAQQHRDLVGRAPTAAESSSAVDALSTGGTTPQAYVEAKLDGSFAPSYAPVARLYFAYFLRSPDVGGLDYWVRRYRGGMKLSAISSNFATSSEFKTKYGNLTNRGFVEKIYTNLFERTGDPSGVSFWTRRLDTKTNTRGQVMIQFSESSEFKRARDEEIDVVLLYRAMLQRAIKGTEFDDQVDRLQDGTTLQRLVLEVLDSAEYGARITK